MIIIIPEEFKTLELLIKDIKFVVLNMFNELKEAMEKKKVKAIKKTI